MRPVKGAIPPEFSALSEQESSMPFEYRGFKVRRIGTLYVAKHRYTTQTFMSECRDSLYWYIDHWCNRLRW